ncbi:MAG TPA: hypothetical protein DIT04_06100 [Dysgonomonas sp.]|nr:hypothetical protein [Dysgonomonas sp.]
METIYIPVSKRKIVFLIAGSLLFVLLGVWLLVYFEGYRQIAGAASILFFGAGLFVFPKKLFDKSPALIIDEKGITDNITKPHIGLIEWKDIVRFDIIRIYSNKMLLIFVINPEEYLDKIGNNKVTGLRNNYKITGTPFVIPSGILKLKIEDVKDLLNMYLENINMMDNSTN